MASQLVDITPDNRSAVAAADTSAPAEWNLPSILARRGEKDGEGALKRVKAYFLSTLDSASTFEGVDGISRNASPGEQPWNR